MFRQANKEDFPAIAALWGEAFGDSNSAVEFFFRSFPTCRSFAAEEDGRIVSMVHALPQRLRADSDLPAAYIYAVATAKAARGRGLCRGLMAFAEGQLRREGFSCCVLTPGEPGLFSFYEVLGYAPVFFRSRSVWNGQGRPIAPEDYAVLRERILQNPHMVCDRTLLEYAQRIYGLTFYETDCGCAAAAPGYTAEVLPRDTDGPPFAMLKWLDVPCPVSRAYLGFALE